MCKYLLSQNILLPNLPNSYQLHNKVLHLLNYKSKDYNKVPQIKEKNSINQRRIFERKIKAKFQEFISRFNSLSPFISNFR